MTQPDIDALECSPSSFQTMVGLPNPSYHPDDFSARLASTLEQVVVVSPVMFVLASDDIDLKAILA